ncbi:MAG TPA: L,D-transpeptidase [Nitrospira sp.]|nr:L,D-transpeptidase [Nitrospira sp.]MBS0163372.1 L,D-transpeptidase [Nitrospira sp.]MBS0175111.1 L,D-transpeptidase [Nitrospira sp.]MBX3338300.1 L,D-transpeptidase [Nitrospira sp.]MCW5778446.1 L,D-transpeptidase [Nitrospira sp.]
MNHTRNIRRIVLRMALIGSLSMSVGGCVETVPEELVEAVESIDRDLFTLRAADLTPEAYSKFSRQWIALRGRIESEENIVRWPWEDNELETELEALQAEGTHLVAEVNSRIQAQRTAAEAKLAKVEQRLRLLNTKVGDIGSRVVLGEHPLETELLVKQARHYLEQGQFDYANQASERASQNLFKQTALLTNELGRYADDDLIAAWRESARRTIDWSRKNRAHAIVISKADRVLTVYKSGRKVLTYPIRLGSKGIRAKQYYGDGATPEGEYRIQRKRGPGQTPYFRALILDYPNAEDRRRFEEAQQAGLIPKNRQMPGLIQLHGIAQGITDQPYGSIVLDNPQIAVLFAQVAVGTPVNIVGALESHNSVSLVLADLGDQEEET